MQEVAAFAFDDSLVRVIDRDGEPWFVLPDVCRVLEHSNPSQAASRLDDDERMTITTGEGHSDGPGGARYLTLVSESGLYSLILTSRKPEAKRFKKWVTAELLPTLRKTGRYEVPGRAGAEPWEWAADRGELHAKLSMVRESRLIFGNASARSLWIKLGLPFDDTSGAIQATVPVYVTATAEAVILLLDRPEVAGAWTGTATDLVRELMTTGVADLPRTNQALGLVLDHVRGLLHDRGVSVGRVKSGSRKIIIRRQVRPAGKA